MIQVARLVCAGLVLQLSSAFLQQQHSRTADGPLCFVVTRLPSSTRTTTTTELAMVFDFFKQRTQEGIDQLGNLADAAKKGELNRGLARAASYTTQTNKAFADGLAKSRNRLLMNMESLLTGVSPEEQMEELQDILLQADLGMTTAEDIVEEVKSLREDSLKPISRNDLKSIMRGKIIEALETGKPRAIRFSDDSSLPTVLFVMVRIFPNGAVANAGQVSRVILTNSFPTSNAN